MRTKILALVCSFSLLAPSFAFAASPARYYGRILVESKGASTAWYVNPVDGKATFLADPKTAVRTVAPLALGITNENLFKIARVEDAAGKFDLALSRRLAGRFLLQVEDKGYLWYVHPTTYKRYFVNSPNDVLALYGAVGQLATAAEIRTLDTVQAYKDAAALFKAAHDGMSKEIAPFKNHGEQRLANGILRRANDKVVVYTFTINSDLATSAIGYPYGPLPKGTYHLTSSAKLMRGDEFLSSDEYLALQNLTRSELVLRGVLQLQTALEFYRLDVGGYPVADEVVVLPADKELVLSREHGFFGTDADRAVYARVRLPKVQDSEYLYVSFDGSDYSLAFRLEKDTGGFRAGNYILSSLGVQAASL